MTRPDWKTMGAGPREKLIRELAGKDYSASVIAGHFVNCSRSAVIGLIKRIEDRDGPIKRNRNIGKNKAAPAPKGITPVGRPSQERQAIKTAAEVKAKKQWINPYNIQMRAANAPPLKDVLPAEKRGSFDPLPGIKPLSILDLPRTGRCRWPVDVPEASLHFACGASTHEDGHVYCASHRRLAIGRPTQGDEHGQGA